MHKVLGLQSLSRTTWGRVIGLFLETSRPQSMHRRPRQNEHGFKYIIPSSRVLQNDSFDQALFDLLVSTIFSPTQKALIDPNKIQIERRMKD